VSADETKREIGPADDPYEFEWPDDAKELREAEREAARGRADVRPAPRYVTAYLIGTGVVLLFIGGFSLMEQTPELFASLVAPIAVAGLVAALPLGIVLALLTRGRNLAIGVTTFLVVGGLVGYLWTYAFINWLIHLYPPSTAEEAANYDGFRVAGSIFMAVAVSSAFVTAFNLTDRARNHPRAVTAGGIVLLVLFVPSAVAAVNDLATALP
jgi:hypothetical protein